MNVKIAIPALQIPWFDASILQAASLVATVQLAILAMVSFAQI